MLYPYERSVDLLWDFLVENPRSIPPRVEFRQIRWLVDEYETSMKDEHFHVARALATALWEYLIEGGMVSRASNAIRYVHELVYYASSRII